MTESIETFMVEFSEEVDKIRKIIERAFMSGYHRGYVDGLKKAEYCEAIEKFDNTKIEDEKILVGDVCVYPKTIDEPFIYLGKVDTWHFALGRKTMEKYSFKGLTGIKKTGEHIDNINDILLL